MEVYRGFEEIKEGLTRPVITIGNFDGVHQGHGLIIEKVVRRARELNGKSVVYTFKPHPQIALSPSKSLELLTTYEERRQLIGDLGVDVLVEQPFSRAFSELPPERFFSDVLLRRLHAAEIIIGYDFGFGKDRMGHLKLLKELCDSAKVTLEVVEAQRGQSPQGRDPVISSSAIRQAIKTGDMKEAAELLGYPFFYRGSVVKGDQRGRQMGFPTANLLLQDKISPCFGVYATEVKIKDQTYRSVTNVGVRPTFQGSDKEAKRQILVESYLIDQSMDLYGSSIEVRFFQKIRDEKKFSSLEELKKQISKDVEMVLSIPWQPS